MTFSPIVVFSMFVASIALGALLISLFIQFNSITPGIEERPTYRQADNRFCPAKALMFIGL